MPHIECVKNNGKPYLWLAESRYVKDIGRQKKFVIKNLERNLKMGKLILME